MSFNVFSAYHILFISIPFYPCWIKRASKRIYSPDGNNVYVEVQLLIKGWIIFTKSALFST